jgi:hypothetical protein
MKTGKQKFHHLTPTEDTGCKEPGKESGERCIRVICEREHLPLISQGPGLCDFMLDDLPIEIHGPGHNDPAQERKDLWKARELVKMGYRDPLWLESEWCNMKNRKYLLRLMLQRSGRSTLEPVDEEAEVAPQ